MAFKMKGAPMHDLSSKHGTNANYKKSGAPGLLGKILDPLGLKNKLMGGKGKPCPPAGQPQPAAPAPNAPAQPAGAAPAAAAPAAVAPEEAAPTQMKEKFKVVGKEKGAAGDGSKKISKGKDHDKMPGKMPSDEFTFLPPGTKKKGAPMKASPAKGKMWDALKKGDFKGAGNTLKHELKGIGAGAKEMFVNDPDARYTKGTRMEQAYDHAKNKSAKKQKMKEGSKSWTPELKSNKSTSTAPPSTAKGKADLIKKMRRGNVVNNKKK